MAIDPGQRMVRRHNAARSSTANATAANLGYDTAVITDTVGYTYTSNRIQVDTAGLYLYLFDIGLVDLASTRAVGTLIPRKNGLTDQTRFRASHRYLRSSGGNDGCSFGCGIFDLAVNDNLGVRNPGALSPTDAVGNYATAAGESGGQSMIRLPANDFTHVERTTDAAEVGTSNINTTRPWTISSGLWTKITYNSEVNDDGAWYPGTGGDITLPANKKFLIVWGVTAYSTDSSRHTYMTGLNIDGDRVQTSSGYQRNTASQGPPMQGLYLHETGGTSETLYLEATHETEGGDAGTPNVSDAYLQVIELPSSAEWIHVDNGAADSLTTALAGTTTWYDTPLSSTFRADGDSNLSLDSVNDAVQNDSGGSLPVLAIGWQRWDRDSGASGTRKCPMLRFENGGSAVQYGHNSAYSRGQQSGDDTFQASMVSAVTVDMANAADLKLQVTDRHSSSNADMGIYASTSRYFLGVQVLNLDTLDAAAGEDNLLADDVESASEVTSPAVGQEHALLADDVQSTSEVTAPSVGQDHQLLADDVESASEVTAPTLAETHILNATDVESASEVTAPSIGQEHAILADDVESASEVTVPSVGQEHALLATSVESASEVTAPVLAENDTEDNLLAEDVESASEVTAPSIGQEHAILADDVESASETSQPSIGQDHQLLADDVESASQVTAPAITQDQALLADDVESASEVTAPEIGQTHALGATSVESASEVTAPALGVAGQDDLLAEDVESASEVTAPSVGQEHSLLADDVQSLSEVSTPSLGQSYVLLAEDVESASEVTTPGITSLDVLLADDVESASEVSTPTLTQAHVFYAESVESLSEVTAPEVTTPGEWNVWRGGQIVTMGDTVAKLVNIQGLDNG